MLNSFECFQGVVATHTDRKQLHNHIVLNSVNWQTGRKWQMSKQDLYRLRELSDKLCMEYGLSVIDKSRSWMPSGEHRAGNKSWKRLLAHDIADCLKRSSSRQDFLHRLDELGLDADFGRKNIMFFVRKDGVLRYGLNKEVSCENRRLMSYGDFSKENIENMLKCSSTLIALGWQDARILQDALLTVGAALFPDTPYHLEQQYFGGVDFSGLTKQEIENYLKQMEWERISRKARLEYEQQWQEKNMILPAITGVFEEILNWKQEQQETEYSYGYEYENEEYEL